MAILVQLIITLIRHEYEISMCAFIYTHANDSMRSVLSDFRLSAFDFRQNNEQMNHNSFGLII